MTTETQSALSRWIPAASIGFYAALVSLSPTVNAIAILTAPLLLLAVAWWTVVSPDAWLRAFLVSALLLPPLPIALGNAGPHPSLLFAACGLWVGLIRLANWRIANDLLTWSLFVFLFVLLLSVPLAAFYSGIEIGAGTLARVFLFGISVYVFFYAAYGPSGNDEFRFTWLLFGAGVAAALFACADFYFQIPAPAGYGPQFVWLESGVYRRAQGLFYEASTLGNFCAFFLVMIAAALLTPPRHRPVSGRVLLVSAPVFVAALVFSYSRASVLNVMIAIAGLLYLYGARLRVRRAAAVTAISFSAGALMAYLALPSFFFLYWNRLLGSIYYFFATTEGILSGRLESWRSLGGFLLENPWHALVGIGYKTLPYSDFIGRPLVADNMYLSLLVETGLLGLGAMLLFNFAILRAAYRAARGPNPRAAFFGSWMFCFWVGQLFQMLSGDLLTYWRVLPLYFWVLAMAVRNTGKPAAT